MRSQVVRHIRNLIEESQANLHQVCNSCAIGGRKAIIVWVKQIGGSPDDNHVIGVESHVFSRYSDAEAFATMADRHRGNIGKVPRPGDVYPAILQ